MDHLAMMNLRNRQAEDTKDSNLRGHGYPCEHGHELRIWVDQRKCEREKNNGVLDSARLPRSVGRDLVDPAGQPIACVYLVVVAVVARLPDKLPLSVVTAFEMMIAHLARHAAE